MLFVLLSLFAPWSIPTLSAAETPVAGQIPLQGIEIHGVRYARLADWAANRRLSTSWTVPRQEFRLLTPGGPIAFWVDSPRILFHGVHIWLSGSVALHDNQFYIPRVDLISTLQPLLHPQLNSSRRRLRTIVIDPGHGGKDPGHRTGSKEEKNYTLLLAGELKSILARQGFNVSLTRTTDQLVDLSERPELARRRGADLFISLHFNAFDSAGNGNTVQGSEVYCLAPAHTLSTNSGGEGGTTHAYPGNLFDAKNVHLAYQLQKSIVTALGSEDRGVKRARFAVLCAAEMPAVLVEGGFMTHPGELQRIQDPAWRHRMAEAIATGIQSYRRLVDPPARPKAP